MSKKKEQHPKIELLYREREEMLEHLRELDDVLLSGDDVNLDMIMGLAKRTKSSESFSKLSDWLKKQIQINPMSTETRLNGILEKLENAFPSSPIPSIINDNEALELADPEITGQLAPQTADRAHAVQLTMILLDNAIMLHIFEHNAAAIIELHGALERYTIDILCELLIVPERAAIGLKLIESRTLRNTSTLLKDCGVFEKLHINFCNRLSRLRNGLAHHNAKGVSRAILGGKDIGGIDLHEVITDEVFFEYFIGTVNACISILNYKHDDIESIPLGFFSEDNLIGIDLRKTAVYPRA